MACSRGNCCDEEAPTIVRTPEGLSCTQDYAWPVGHCFYTGTYVGGVLDPL